VRIAFAVLAAAALCGGDDRGRQIERFTRVT
jgi:hypothetical protein